MSFGISGRLRPRFMVRDRSVVTGYAQRHPQRFGVRATDPVTGAPFEITMFRYPAAPDAPQLLAVHGFRGDHHGLELLVDGLTDYDVWVPDLPGFGTSPALPRAEHSVAHYANIITQLADRLDSPVLLGHSFGTIIAAYAAAQTPTAYAHLVLLNPIARPALAAHHPVDRAATAITDGFYQLCTRLPTTVSRWMLSHPVMVWATGVFMSKTDDPRLIAYTHDQHQAYFSAFASPDVLLQAYRASITHTVADVAENLSLPITLVGGAHDPMVSPPELYALADSLAQATDDVETYILDRTGHLLHYERAVTAASLIQLRLRA